MDKLKPYVNLADYALPPEIIIVEIMLEDGTVEQVLEEQEPEFVLVELEWCNDAIAHASDYYRHITGKRLSFKSIMQQYKEPAICTALFFGALRVATGMQLREFSVKHMSYEQIYLPVKDGLENYFDASNVRRMPEGDEEWPDTQKQVNKPNEDIELLTYQAIMRKWGFSLAEIGRMTMRGMQAAALELSGVKESDDSWLFGEEGEGDVVI